jgi:hypothetical protein
VVVARAWEAFESLAMDDNQRLPTNKDAPGRRVSEKKKESLPHFEEGDFKEEAVLRVVTLLVSGESLIGPSPSLSSKKFTLLHRSLKISINTGSIALSFFQ